MRPVRLCIVAFVLAILALPALAQTNPVSADIPKTPPPAYPRVALETSAGRIVVELYSDKAPKTVANFLLYAHDGHYNGTVFHRVIADLLIQGGAFTLDLQQKPERAPIANESNNGLSNLRGTMAAARRPSDSDSATAQFFINTADNRQFDATVDSNANTSGYCVFGRVVEGMEVVDRIRVVATTARSPFASDVPTTPIVIEHVIVLAAKP